MQNKIPEWHSMPKVISAQTAASQSRMRADTSAFPQKRHTVFAASITSAIIRMSLRRKCSAAVGTIR